MKSTEAIGLMLDGKILVGDGLYLRIKNNRLEINAICNGVGDDCGGGWLPGTLSRDYLSYTNLSVYEPKSKIEKAIENELPEDHNGYLRETLVRVVNIALDEAQKAINPDSYYTITDVNNAKQRIDALKVKE